MKNVLVAIAFIGLFIPQISAQELDVDNLMVMFREGHEMPEPMSTEGENHFIDRDQYQVNPMLLPDKPDPENPQQPVYSPSVLEVITIIPNAEPPKCAHMPDVVEE